MIRRWTTRLIVAATVAAALGVMMRGDTGAWLDSAALLLLGGLPILRVGALAMQWSRDGDRRFAAAAGALLVLTLFGVGVVALLR